MFSYVYQKQVNIDRLTKEIVDSNITIVLDHIDSLGLDITIWFKAELSIEEEITLSNIVSSHEPIALLIEETKVVLTDGQGNVLNQIDNDKAQIVRVKAAKRGWVYSAISMEFCTGAINTKFSEDADGNDRDWISIKYYDGYDQEVTEVEFESTIVKTVVDFMPPYDYEVIGGSLRTLASIENDLRLWIIAVPDIPISFGGSKEMASGINLKFMSSGNVYDVDGRVSKMLVYDPIYKTNKLRLLFKQPPNTREYLSVVIELYRG